MFKQLYMSNNLQLKSGILNVLRRAFTSGKLPEFNPQRDKLFAETKAPCEPEPPKCPPETPTKRARSDTSALNLLTKIFNYTFISVLSFSVT